MPLFHLAHKHSLNNQHNLSNQHLHQKPLHQKHLISFLKQPNNIHLINQVLHHSSLLQNDQNQIELCPHNVQKHQAHFE